MDQPLYALGKQLQWEHKGQLAEDKLVIVLGGLHIEMSFMSIIGDWLEGSGWSTAIVDAGVTTTGRGEALLSGSHVKRSRHVHQVTKAALHVLRERTYSQFQESEEHETKSPVHVLEHSS